MPDALLRIYLVAHHAGQGVDLRRTIAKLFFAFPQIDLPEPLVREAVGWCLGGLGSLSVRKARETAQLLQLAGSDPEIVADQAVQILARHQRGASRTLPLDRDEMIDLLSVTTIGPEAVGIERLQSILARLDEKAPGDLFLDFLITLTEKVGQSSDDVPDPQRQSHSDSVADRDWDVLLWARDHLFDFARCMETFRFVCWMDRRGDRQELLWNGLVEQNFILYQTTHVFTGKVRTLLRPPLDASLFYFSTLVSSPDLYSPYFQTFIERFDELFHKDAIEIWKRLDTSTWMDSVRRDFSVKRRL